MNSNKAYWFSQIIGWTVYNLSELFSYFFIFSFSYTAFNDVLGTALVNIASGIMLTHLFRIIFKRYNWIKLPLPQLVLQCVAAMVLITFILAAINIPMDAEIINTEKVNWALRDISYILNLGKPVLIWMLIYTFYSFTNERQNDLLERLRLESSAKETEAKILRAQMNPHFMFNALNSIRALISEEPNKAITGITQLSNILRSSLVADRRTTVTVKEELKTIEDYLALEKVRYEERLQSKLVIDPESLNVQIPPMMIQTLVENAIKHGVQKASRWGFIELVTKIENEKLYLKIRNTGQLKDKTVSGSGYGLSNTKRRLQLLYGNEASIKVYQENHLTVCAEVSLPKDFKYEYEKYHN